MTYWLGFLRSAGLLLWLGCAVLLSACVPSVEESAVGDSPPSHDAEERTTTKALPLGGVRASSSFGSSGSISYSEAREPCVEHDPVRRALWGELHVHSGDSMDAYMWDVRGTPDEIYRFARGETIHLAPLDETGHGTRPVRLERPLDFAALTDHASYLGEVAFCSRPNSPLFDSKACQVFREGDPGATSPLGELGIRMSAISKPLMIDEEIPSRLASLCGPGFSKCIAKMGSVWQEQKIAAERYYDRSSHCAFTTFHGYEYSATPALSKVHHNVIYRNDSTPPAPIAWVDEPDVYGLWEKLDAECLSAGTGCDVLTIPHNSNLSSGRMFTVTGRDLPLEVQRERARLRSRLEPLVEISQIKGDSECRNGMYGVVGATDEFCDTVEWGRAVEADCKEGSGSGVLMGKGCVSRTDFVRYTLLEGFRERARLGINPYKLGIIAATDAHNGNPGDTEEFSNDGWGGLSDDTPAKRLEMPAAGDPMRGALANGSGGLAGVWAEENSRDAIFDAMKRRETFGTSGTRMTARFFGGWEFDPMLCESPDVVEAGYAGGIPMGGDLSAPPGRDSSPSFLIAAMSDPGAPGRDGTALQRAQVIKGWVDDEGQFRQQVFDAAGGPNGASVDLNSCTPQGPGERSLCTVWKDPDFDGTRDAVYYLRVLENPSCRWNQFECNRLPAEARPAACSDPAVVRTVQERLWTSPIWYDANS
jgi:hypothetical protein